jgi:hypothetical protein
MRLAIDFLGNLVESINDESPAQRSFLRSLRDLFGPKPSRAFVSSYLLF